MHFAIRAGLFEFIVGCADKNQKDIRAFSEDGMQALMSYDWGGNVRELENAVKRAVVFTNTPIVPLSALTQFMSHFSESRHLLKFKIGTPLDELASQAIEITLAHTRGDKTVAARLLGVSPRTIYRHLDWKEEKPTSEAVARITIPFGHSMRDVLFHLCNRFHFDLAVAQHCRDGSHRGTRAINTPTTPTVSCRKSPADSTSTLEHTGVSIRFCTRKQ